MRYFLISCSMRFFSGMSYISLLSFLWMDSVGSLSNFLYVFVSSNSSFVFWYSSLLMSTVVFPLSALVMIGTYVAIEKYLEKRYFVLHLPNESFIRWYYTRDPSRQKALRRQMRDIFHFIFHGVCLSSRITGMRSYYLLI